MKSGFDIPKAEKMHPGGACMCGRYREYIFLLNIPLFAPGGSEVYIQTRQHYVFLIP